MAFIIMYKDRDTINDLYIDQKFEMRNERLHIRSSAILT